MKVSMKGDYGIRALMDLALHYGQGPIQSADIAQRQYIPEPYLDQLLTTLRKAGFIRSRRGPQGGHTLARDPKDIPLSEVISALEGSVAAVGCLDGSVDCALTGTCSQQEVWDLITRNTRTVLETTTIGDLVQRQQQINQTRVMYYI
ncbi:MAG: Rrf2 family transcriptional regulator [Chloroflexi bacterium]|nr:Rrf2 family transcriptional regulator [Chloroflexota bacterium]